MDNPLAAVLLAAVEAKDAQIEAQALELQVARDTIARQSVELEELKRRTVAAFDHLRLIAASRGAATAASSHRLAPPSARTLPPSERFAAAARDNFPITLHCAASGANAVTLRWTWPTGSSLFEVLAIDIENGG